MAQNQHSATLSDQGIVPEALSNEVLKLKIDDLYQEIETLKSGLKRLEERLAAGAKPRRGRAVASSRNVCEPNDR